jgi:hypothetical protein
MTLRLLLAVGVFASIGNSVSAKTTSMGSSPEEFRSVWGAPAREERLSRTTSILWKFNQRRTSSLSPDIAQVEVFFLDRMACQVIVRSRRTLTRERIAELAKALVPAVRKTGVPVARKLRDGARTYALHDGGYMTVWAEEKPAVMLIRSRVYLQNKEVFDREAAKVRPPTASH